MALRVLLFHYSFHRRHNGLGHGVDFDVDLLTFLKGSEGGQAKRFWDEMDVKPVALNGTDGQRSPVESDVALFVMYFIIEAGASTVKSTPSPTSVRWVN